MDLTNLNTPEHVVGKSLKPLFMNPNASVRESALTRWRNGYSIKTKDIDLQKWGVNGELGYELYDHENDKNELINLVSNKDYNKVKDSLKLMIDQRIAEASIKPKGLEDNLKMLNLCTRRKILLLGIFMIQMVK